MTFSTLYTTAPDLWQYLRYCWNDMDFSFTLLSFDWVYTMPGLQQMLWKHHSEKQNKHQAHLYGARNSPCSFAILSYQQRANYTNYAGCSSLGRNTLVNWGGLGEFWVFSQFCPFLSNFCLSLVKYSITKCWGRVYLRRCIDLALYGIGIWTFSKLSKFSKISIFSIFWNIF